MASRPETTPEYREALRDLARGAGAASARRLFRQPAAPGAAALHDPDLRPGDLERQHRHAGRADADRGDPPRLPGGARLPAPADLHDPRRRASRRRLGQPVFEAAVETARAARAARLDRGNARPRRPAQLRRRRRDRAADGFGGHALLSLRAVPAQPGLRRHRPRRHACCSPPSRSPPSSSCAARTRAPTWPPPACTATPPRRSATPRSSSLWGCCRPSRGAGGGSRRRRSRASSAAGRSPGVLAAAAKTLRIGLQIAVVGAGAVLVIEGMASGGTIVAAAVLSARLLLPFEQLIDGWRQWLDAFAALDRLRDVLSRGAHDPVAPAGGGGARDARRRPARLRAAGPGPALAPQRVVPRRGRRARRRDRPVRARASRRWRAHRRALGADDRRHLSRRAEHLHPRARQLRRGGRLPAAGADALRGQGPREHRPLPRCRHGRRRRRGAPRRRARADRAHAAAATRRGSPTPARVFPAASGSGWRWRGRSSGTRSSSCSTSRTRTSMPRGRRR